MKQLFSLRGRATRLQWWTIWLVIVLLGPLVDMIVAKDDVPAWIAVWGVACVAVMLWIGLAANVRRWHDINRSGWMSLVFLVPLLGPLIVLLYNGCIPGDASDNRYGAPAL
ncbi:DUF805 domain-containing protein [Xanthomonas floridensis]|nr:DUF805 domain-containing protein [Xanthomonas floridensis]MEA5122583.1 DUF805 domain-containing protein [Xanthomonas floridensis]MEA5134033.1 DUF805 domain-containing protein [Xanthomonas floridensis]